MAIHHVDATGVPTPLPHGLPEPGSALWFEIRPNLKRSAVIASDMLASLGKRRDVAGKGRNENQDIALVLAWLHAYDITALVAVEAQHLTRLTMSHLAALAKAARLPLWLLHRPPRSDDFLRNLARLRAHPLRLGDVPRPQVHQTAVGHRLGLGLSMSSPPPFDKFRSTLRDHLTPAQYETMADHFDQTFAACDEVLDRDGPSADVIAYLVERIMAPAPEDDALITGVRALQLAAWHHDLYVKVNVAALLASSERQTVDPVSMDTALVGYRQPHRALVVALAAQQVGVTATLSLTLDDADDGFARLATRGQLQLHEHTRRAADAQVELRRRQGASRSEPLFQLTDRAVSSALNQAALDFGIAVHGRRAERYAYPRRWLDRLGISIATMP